MTTRKPLVLVGSQLQEIATTDVLTVGTATAGDSSNTAASTAFVAAGFMNLATTQTIAGAKTFQNTLFVPPANAAIQTSAVLTGEWHPWLGLRDSSGHLTYQYLSTTTCGVYDTAVGSLWSFSFTTGLLATTNSPPAGDRSGNLATTAFVAAGFMDLATTQTIAGAKNFTGHVGVGSSAGFTPLQVVGHFSAYTASAVSSSSPIGASIYLGDSNFDSSGFFNSAPGIGAVYEATYGIASALAFYVFQGTANSRFEAARISGAGVLSLTNSPPVSDNSTNAATTAFTRSLIGYVTPQMFGAKGNGQTDDGPAFNAAIATGSRVYIPPGNYYIKTPIVCPHTSQIIEGAGRVETTLSIDGGFLSANPSATGVITFTCGEPGPVLRDFSMIFAQPDTVSGNPVTLATLLQYPPAVYAQQTPRFMMERLGFYACIIAVDMRYNCGGAKLDDIQLSALADGMIYIDGSLDTVRIDAIHAYPFNLQPNQTALFYNTGTGHVTAIKAGRVDGLYVNRSLFFCGAGFESYTGTLVDPAGATPSPYAGAGFGAFTGCDFDTFNGAVITAGDWKFACDFTVGNTGASAFQQSGGNVVMAGSRMFIGTGGTQFPLISLTGGNLTLAGVSFNSAFFDRTSVLQTGGIMTMSGCNYIRSPNTAYTNPTINVSGGTIVATGNAQNQAGTGSGVFFKVAAANFHRLLANSAPGYTNSLPSPGTTDFFAYNSSATS